MSDLNFQPLLFGGDINVYSVARAFHEAYGVRSIAYGKYPSFPCHGSAIIDYRVCPDNESADAFRRNAKAVAEEFPDKTILLLGCGDSYVQLAAHCKDQLPANVVAPYIDGALLDTLINKEKFYQLCDRYGVDHPATFIYDKSMGHDFSLPFGPPYIAKPADSVAYWATGVHALAKVYICQTWEELLSALDQVYEAGYPDHMVLQEFIPGDDTYMRVLDQLLRPERTGEAHVPGPRTSGGALPPRHRQPRGHPHRARRGAVPENQGHAGGPALHRLLQLRHQVRPAGREEQGLEINCAPEARTTIPNS